ncbi:MAG: hypothetical protein WAW92_02105 [Minisyncoccia bacterium]
MKKELLVPLTEFYKIEHQIPYTYVIQKEGQYLYYFGSKHSFDSENPQFEEIRNFFNDFVSHTTRENSIVLVEGGERPIAKSEKEAIKEGAEMNFVTYLASKAERHVTSPEIPDQKRFELLHEHFSKEEIAYYCFIQVCWQWNTIETNTDFKKYIQVFLENNKKKSGWDDIDFSYENMIHIHERLFSTQFDPRDKDFLSSILDPRLETSIINKISAYDDSVLRDNYILDEIDKYWKKGLSIFIIYGHSHTVMQEPVLRSLE